MPRKKVDPSDAPEELGIEQFELPRSVVSRVAKASLPPGTQLQKDVALAIGKGTTVFINYAAALAHDAATQKGQKTLQAAHVLEAINQLGWQDGPQLHSHLKKELRAYRKVLDAKKAPRSYPSAPAPAAAAAGPSTAAAPTPAPAAAATGESAPDTLQHFAPPEDEPEHFDDDSEDDDVDDDEEEDEEDVDEEAETVDAQAEEARRAAVRAQLMAEETQEREDAAMNSHLDSGRTDAMEEDHA